MEETTISYLICTLKKYNNKKRDNVTPIEKENERDENYSPDNPQIDLSRTHNNYHTVYPQGSYMEYINERISTLPLKRKVRSDAVLMCSFIIGSDGNFFIGLTPWERQRFFEDATEYFAERFGRENIISSVVHTDETTPHLHLNLIPIVGNKLSAKQLFTRASLRELQTDFHEKVGKKWGLERGKEGSQAKHIDTAEFKAKTIIDRAEKRAEETEKQAKTKAEEYLSGIESSIEAERSKPIPKKKKAVEAEIESLRVENAAYKKHIAIKNRDTDYLFEQLQKAERQGKVNDTAFKMVTDMMSAYPDEFDALLRKSRAKKSPPTSFNVNRNTSGKGGK